jgi:hypothetical protein
MKIIKFKNELCDLVLSRGKTSTWRLFDDKDLQLGDEIKFMNKDTGDFFGTGKILKLKITTLGSLEESDWEGHETYSSEEEMYETYKTYYGDKVGPDSELKIIDFSFNPL